MFLLGHSVYLISEMKQIVVVLQWFKLRSYGIAIVIFIHTIQKLNFHKVENTLAVKCLIQRKKFVQRTVKYSWVDRFKTDQ